MKTHDPTMVHRGRRRTWILSAFVVTAMLLAGCSASDEPSASLNYVDVDGDTESASGSSVAAVSPSVEVVAASASDGVEIATLSTQQFDDVVMVFEMFLNQRASAVLGEIDTDKMGSVATDRAMTQIRALHETNEQKIADEASVALRSLTEWPNVTTVEKVGEGYVFVDCTERQQININGRSGVHFVTNSVQMVTEAGELKVDRVDQLQSGDYALEVGEYGCVPPSFVARAEAVATSAIKEAAAGSADPARSLEAGLSPVFQDQARTDLEYALAFLESANLRRDPTEQVTLKVVGMDVNKSDYTVIVSVCRQYPQGRFFMNTETGNAEIPDIGVGGSEEEWIYVSLEPVASGTETADAAVSVAARPSTSCWKG